MKLNNNITNSMLIALALFLLLSTVTFAIPNSITLQGKLTNANGVSQVGTFNFTFRIYDAFTNGNALWELPDYNITTDANGVYDVILGSINLSFADAYYLGITVRADNESSPRINLTSSPYAFRANVSEGLNANNSYVVTNLSITGNATIGTGGTTLAISTQTFNLTTIGNINLASNISLGDKISFRFGQSIDNLINGWLRLTGALNVTSNLSVNIDTFYVDTTSGRVGIGITNPTSLLHVIGNVNATGNVTLGKGNTTLEISTQNFNVSNGNLALSGSIKAGGGLNVSGDTNVSNFYVTGNTVLGDSTSDTIAVNAQFISNLIPQTNNIDLGSASNFWRRAYIDLATISNLSVGGTDIGGTTSPTFVFNSNYSGNDARDIELIFERCTPTTNAVLKWDSGSKRFDINFPLLVQANMNLTVDTNTLFVDGSVHRVGIGTTSPSETLTVIGNANISGYLNISGDLIVNKQFNVT